MFDRYPDRRRFRSRGRIPYRDYSHRRFSRRFESRRPYDYDESYRGGNRYRATINRILDYTARHPVVARSIYNAIGRQQGYRPSRAFTARAPRDLNRQMGQAPAHPNAMPNSHPGFNKQHPYYSHLYISKAWVGENPKTRQPIVYIVANRRRDLNPQAKLAGAHVFHHQGRDGKNYYDQPLSTSSFNKIRQATGRSPMTNQQYGMYIGSRHLFASTQDNMAFDAHIFKNRTPNRPAYQNPYLISVKSIKAPAKAMDVKKEQKLDQQAYQQSQQQNQGQNQNQNQDQNQGSATPQNSGNTPAGNAPKGTDNTHPINPFANSNQNEDDGPEA